MTRALALGGLLAAVALAWGLGAFDRLTLSSVTRLLRDAGPLAPLLFVALYVLGESLAIPSVIFVIAAGLTWPAAQAFGIAWVGSLTASAFVFLVVRYLARDWAQARFPPRLRSLDERLGRGGPWPVAGIRLVAFLAPWTHPALAVSRVRTRDYLLGTGIGITPGVLGLVIFGQAVAPWLGDVSIGALVLIALAVVALTLGRSDG